jgi:organic hydroperoxide reductase OsmC/OhrA
MKQHHYHSTTTWTGNRGSGTSDYKAYERSHLISVDGKPDIEGSSDAAFRGDKSKHTPEDMLVISLSTCHMLWYLHLCAVNGVVVTEYVDNATGIMEEDAKGSGYFKEVTLHPRVTVSDKAMIEKANALHHEANNMCFIANSVKFPVYHKALAVEAPVEKIKI